MPSHSHIITFSFFTLLALLISSGSCAQNYLLVYHEANKDTMEPQRQSLLRTNFDNRLAAQEYIGTLPQRLGVRGYPAASVDSVHYDSLQATVWLYFGSKFHWTLDLDSIPPDVKQAVNIRQPGNITYDQLKNLQQKILNYYENTGYPFARVYTESEIREDTIATAIRIDPRVQYHIDSIRIIGTGKLRNRFLQHYLGIPHGSLYNKQKLSQVHRLMSHLPYIEQLQHWDLMMLGTGATLNLYLAPRKSSEINALVGFLPSDNVTGKTKITADVRLNLKNALAGGETILLNWQQLEAQSPKLDIGFTQPFLFNTPYGIDLSFGLFKKDSAYLQLNYRLGAEYIWTATQTISVFYQVRNNYLLQGGLDTNSIRFSRRLPANMDVRSSRAGLSYHFNNLDYRFNPRRGFEIAALASAGIRRVQPNQDIVGLKDPFDPDFDFGSLYDSVRLRTHLIMTNLAASRFIPAGRNSVLKFGIDIGWIVSPQIFQNEVYRIGGYRLLRGFDEESIYADRYSVLTAEYRLLTGINSYIFAFADAGFTHNEISSRSYRNSFLSTGLGLELETGFGLLNVSYAIGKRNDIKFDIRNASKIHFGYINYF